MLRKRPFYLLKNILSQTKKFNSEIVWNATEKSKIYSDEEKTQIVSNLRPNLKLNELLKPQNYLDEELSILEQDPIISTLSDNEYNPNEYNFLDTEEEKSLNTIIDDYFNKHKVNFKGILNFNLDLLFDCYKCVNYLDTFPQDLLEKLCESFIINAFKNDEEKEASFKFILIDVTNHINKG